MKEYWVARDRNGKLYLIKQEYAPKRIGDIFSIDNADDFYRVDEDLFPEVTWENSPKKIKIELVT